MDPPKKIVQLTEDQGRLVLKQLYEDERLRNKVAGYEEWIVRERELYKREQDANKELLDARSEKLAVCSDRVSLYKEEAATYKALYLTVTKKRGGIGCFFRAFFTIGISRCK